MKIEQKSVARDVVLRFDDGSTRAVRVRDPLSVVLASWSRRHSETTGKPAPESKYDAALDLFDAAETVESDQPIFDLVLKKRER
ncbi:MAG TPA: hypothetical protein VMW54_11810 [Terriglobia bacterium]|nr:hypothetical protein [Terriglobia bacterium]